MERAHLIKNIHNLIEALDDDALKQLMHHLRTPLETAEETKPLNNYED